MLQSWDGVEFLIKPCAVTCKWDTYRNKKSQHKNQEINEHEHRGRA